MKPNNTNQNRSNSQQNNQQSQPMGAPQAASTDQVDRVEQKAESAEQKADMAHDELEALRQENERLEQRNEELRSLVERTVAAIRRVDEHLTLVEKNQAGSMTSGSYESEPIADQASLPNYEELETVKLKTARTERTEQ
jgi:regulator of replication initiation timing